MTTAERTRYQNRAATREARSAAFADLIEAISAHDYATRALIGTAHNHPERPAAVRVADITAARLSVARNAYEAAVTAHVAAGVTP